MNHPARTHIPLLLLSTVLFASCFSTYQVESARRINREDAHLTIFRKGVTGFAVGTLIFANGQFVGKVGANRYISCWLPEGEYLMSVRTTKADEVFFKVRMAAGKNYSYSVSYDFGRNGGRPSIHVLNDASVIERRKPPVVNYFD
jgi:hypothetical protein